MTGYDAVVVGARCAGAATAMLLARRGHRVLLVDRGRFPSDTVSTHLLHAPGVAALARWGLLERLSATGCPPITRYAFDFGPFVLRGSPPPAGGTGTAYCPRRTVLDKLLVDAAAEAGADVREGFPVRDVLVRDGRAVGVRGGDGDAPVCVPATVVVGADGARSRVAEAVDAPRYREGPVLSVGYYAYWSGAPVGDAGWVVRPGRGYGAFPTHDGLTMVLAAWPRARLPELRRDVEGGYLRAVHEVYGEALAGACRATRVVGGAVGNLFRRPYGPGWALVGDAGHHLDAVTAQGMTDAFLDAELCAAALHEALTGVRPYGEAMAGYQRRRDRRVVGMHEFTGQLATMQPPPPELLRVIAGAAGDQPAMDRFAGVFAGTVPVAEFLGQGP